MGKHLKFFVFFLVIAGCVEPYTFVIHDETKTLVVEAYISDKSYNETLLYPSDGRYFSVKLSYSGDVTNTRPDMVLSAQVLLISDQGEQWTYTESFTEPGIYQLLDVDFKAAQGVKYKLQITPPQDELYESDWESMPTTAVPAMGEISFREMETQKYEFIAGEKVISRVQGITTQLDVPENQEGEKIFYRWKFTPIWIFNSSLTSVSSPVHKCWVLGNTYLTNYILQVDNAGGYQKDMFFMETVRNERIYEDLSVLVTQFASSEENYTFWREMQEQVQAGTFKDSPPFNLQTNLHSQSGDKFVSGYFGVVQEQTKRWYFNKMQLSYFVTDDLKASCLADPLIIPEECVDCRAYPFGISRNTKPTWWRN